MNTYSSTLMMMLMEGQFEKVLALEKSNELDEALYKMLALTLFSAREEHWRHDTDSPDRGEALLSKFTNWWNRWLTTHSDLLDAYLEKQTRKNLTGFLQECHRLFNDSGVFSKEQFLVEVAGGVASARGAKHKARKTMH